MHVTYGVDVSHHQAPSAVPWDTIAATSSFCVARATYGSRRDRQVVEHVRRARAVGLQVGLYAFFRSTERPIEQLSAFRAAAQAAGYAPGDIVPALDVEADPNVAEVSPMWEPAVREMCDALAKDYSGVIIYITQREWRKLGMPTWVTQLPNWTAHYTSAERPLTPGNVEPLLWQHRIGPYDPSGPGGSFKGDFVIDQNRAFGPLPVASRVPWLKTNTPVVTGPTLRDVATAAQAHRIDDIGILRANAMKDMAGIESIRPVDIDNSDGGPDAA